MFSSYKIRLKSVDSTNNYAAKLIKETNVQEFTAILAEEQVSGRGQRGNAWESEAGKNLTLSFILKPETHIDQQFDFSIMTALSCIRVLKDYGLNAQIKWPNDIYVGAAKIGGILIENTIRGSRLSHVIIGVGLNLNQRNFSNSNATSLSLQLNQDIDMPVFEDALLSKITGLYLQLKSGKNFLPDYYAALLGYQQDMSFEMTATGKVFQAKVMGVNKKGQLHLLNHVTGLECFYDIKTLKWLI